MERDKLLAAIKACLPDLEHYATTHGPGPDKRLAALLAAINKVEGAIPDMEETPVIFRVWRTKAGGVLALLPTLPCDYTGRYITSYEHVGQHGDADYRGCIARTRPATEPEYADLKAELEQIGYRVKPCYRQSQAHRAEFARNLERIK